jgi:MtaA/CmuA family methyltransferase
MPDEAGDSREMIARALAGLPTPRPATGPLAVHYCAQVCGVSLRQYTTDARTMANCIVRYHDMFRPDAVWLSADTWVTAQAMGARVAFPSDHQPMGGVGEPLVQTPADIDKIPAPDPARQGRWPLMIEALERVVRALGEHAFIVACFDQYPFSLACALMGIDRVMTALMDDRSMVEALMDRCHEYAAAYARALAQAGADMLSGGDSPAGLIGPQRYREVAWSAEQRLIQQIRSSTSLPISLHICGDSTPILSDMAASGASVLELDHQVDVAEACRLIGPDVVFWGNLDPVGILAQSDVDTVKQRVVQVVQTMTACNHRRFVLSSGCTLAVETPPDNLRAMFSAADNLSNR